MKFEQCNPYVRYCDIIKTDLYPEPELFLKSYDNCMIYLLSGAIKICIENKTYDLSHGDILFWRAGMKYSIISHEIKSSYILVNFDFTERRKSSFNIKIPPETVEKFDEEKITDKNLFVWNKLLSLRSIYEFYSNIEIEEEKEVVLLCYESSEKPCHRHLLTDYIREKNNIIIEEL